MKFRAITRQDLNLILPILRDIANEEETIYLGRDATDADIEHCMFGKSDADNYETWVVENDDGAVMGTYFLCPNHSGLGNHIGNGGYMVDKKFRGQGIGRKMGEHSIARALELGFQAMQFNFVISTNIPAINIWRDLGFEIIATIPNGYHRKRQEYVDAHVMFKDFR